MTLLSTINVLLMQNDGDLNERSEKLMRKTSSSAIFFFLEVIKFARLYLIKRKFIGVWNFLWIFAKIILKDVYYYKVSENTKKILLIKLRKKLKLEDVSWVLRSNHKSEAEVLVSLIQKLLNSL